MPEFREREPAVFTGLALVLIVLWLGFLVHTSPGFPGSLLGHSLGILGATLMLVPLAYLVVKRVRRLRTAITRRWSMRTLLAWHIYAGILGPILVLLHTGHRFESPLGIALTTATIVVALSGFVGRFLMKRVRTEIAALDQRLGHLRRQRATLMAGVAGDGGDRPGGGPLASLRSALFVQDPADAGRRRAARLAMRLATSEADVEYARATHELFKTAFGAWLKVHIAISLVLYALLGLHVWATIHFGLRWLA